MSMADNTHKDDDDNNRNTAIGLLATHQEQPAETPEGDTAVVAMDTTEEQDGRDCTVVLEHGTVPDTNVSTPSPTESQTSNAAGTAANERGSVRDASLCLGVVEACEPQRSGLYMPYDMSDEALNSMLMSTIESIGPLYPDEDDPYGDDQYGGAGDGDGDDDDDNDDDSRPVNVPLNAESNPLYGGDHQHHRMDRQRTEKTAGRERPPAEDEPLAKRRQVEEQIEAPPRPRRGRPPGRTSGPRPQTQSSSRLALSALHKRFVRESSDAAAREVCEVRLVGVRHNAIDRQDDGNRHVDHNGVRLSTADDGALPPALSFRRLLDAESAARVYTCVGERCGRRFACTNQNAPIACGPQRRAPPPPGRDGDNNDDDALDGQDADTAVDPAVDGVPVDGFVCPLHGARHAYCASCLIAHMELDLPLDDDDSDHVLEGRWPVRCPGFTSVWLTQPPPPVGTRPLPRGGSVAAVDPSVIASSTIARCPFVLGPRFVRALVERCRPAAIQRAFGVTFGMACEAVADDPDIATVGEDDDFHSVDLYNTALPGTALDDADQDRRGGDDVNDNDDDDVNSDRHRALRLTRQKGLTRLRAMAEAEYRRRATTTNPQYWISTCPYDGCNATVHLDRMFAFNMVCLVCQACKRCYCSGCREPLANDGSPEDAALRRQHEIGCYTYAHAPWFDKDVGFLERVLRDPATAAAADPARPPRTDGGASQAARPRTVIEILLDAGGGAAVRRAIAARIAECLVRADHNGSTQRCPTCHRRTNMNDARAPTRDATIAALARAHATRNLAAAHNHAHRLAGVYSTLVDWCACGTVWCYVCERVCPVSRAQAKAAEVVKAVEWIDTSASLVSYGVLSSEFDPPAPPVPCSSSTASSTSVGADVGNGTLDVAWAEREMARVYWHEAPEYGPWRHTADWARHVRSSRCGGDPLWAKRWPACPPSMADLGDLAGCGFVPASGASSLSQPVLAAARARAGRSNIERFHAIKRRRLTEEIIRCVDSVPWIDADMIAAVRDWLPDHVWQRAVHIGGHAWTAAHKARGQQQQQTRQQSLRRQQQEERQQHRTLLFDLDQTLRQHCPPVTPATTQIEDLDVYPSWVSMLDPVAPGPLH
ncbi:hypothetical protein pneo_cds_27 [Pandoravirus neocaledonia]|uniref:Uncharacterized protein n=1 Tax=Pandoravirus neocaledonia TaxID=2107708 RepID=A0A2U7UB20_9VIRU|nr:hypothetical protein pneo_cds_27 [Pandoravirus neocaledonia]AVK75634.1 hypothetical protein pneo_cds_27 [Pandoravirus neocaledonia]